MELAENRYVILSSIMLVLFAIWVINKLNHSKKGTPAKQQPAIQQIQKTDSIETNKSITIADTLSTSPLPTQKKPAPVTETIKQPDHPVDSQPVFQPLQKLDRPSVSLRDDSTTASPPAAFMQLPTDTLKLKPSTPQKKDDGYYFDVKKKKRVVSSYILHGLQYKNF